MLVETLGAIDGYILYKLIIIQIINQFCIDSLNYEDIDDLKMQMIKKLARRLYKLNLFTSKNATKLEFISNLSTKTFQDSYKTIKIVRDHLEAHLKILMPRNISPKPKFSIENGLKYNENSSFNREVKRMKSLSLKTNQNMLKISQYYKRNLLNSNFPDLALFKVYDKDTYKAVVELYDIENWILCLPDNFLIYDTEFSVKLFDLFRCYIRVGLKFYEKDELGYSRMILVSMKIICALDKIARALSTIFKNHKIGIESLPFESLLLPDLDHVKIAFELKKYIDEKNSSELDPSLVDPKIGPEQFSAKYARKNPEMQKVRQNILAYIETKIQEKYKEVDSARKKYNEMIKIWPSHQPKIDKNGNPYHNPNNCEFCIAESIRVNVYEKLIPDDETSQNIIVFELQIPTFIGVLREAIHLFRKEVLKTEIFGSDTRLKWVENQELVGFSNKVGFDFTLGSIKKSFAISHYSGLAKHPKNDYSEFILPNASTLNHCSKELNCSINYRDTKFESNCVLKAEGPYNVLQWTIDSTNHTENQVIARQSECGQGLNLKEFLNFGFFRAGHNLQTKNLLVSLETRSLSLNKQGVFALIAQSMWELGTLNKGDFMSSDFIKLGPHADFRCGVYMANLERVLKELVEISRNKWDDQLVLLILVLILSKAVQLSSDKAKWVDLLVVCRNIAKSWIEKIEKIIEELKTSDKKEDQDDCFNLRVKLYQILCFLLLTYDVGRANANLVMVRPKDASFWLDAVYKLYNFSSLHGFCPSDAFNVNLKRRVDVCMINIEEEYTYVVSEDDYKLLECFVSQKWSDFELGLIKNWEKLGDLTKHRAFFVRNCDKQNKT
jgi:hypothetical protein